MARVFGLSLDGDNIPTIYRIHVFDDETKELIANETVTLLPTQVDDAVEKIKKEFNVSGYPEVDIHIYAC